MTEILFVLLQITGIRVKLTLTPSNILENNLCGCTFKCTKKKLFVFNLAFGGSVFNREIQVFIREFQMGYFEM